MNEATGNPEPGAGGEEPLEVRTLHPHQVTLLDTRRRPVGNSYAPRRTIRSHPRWALFLFLATCVSVFLAGMVPGKGVAALYGWDPSAGPQPPLSEMLLNGLTYFAALMTILFAHEMGHYLQSLRYGVPASFPYFFPFPTPIGTLGAVIVQGPGVANRKSLFDIAVSGPLAGLVFALPVTAIGIWKAQVSFADPPPGEPIWGMPLVLEWLVHWIRGPLPPNAWLADNAWLFAGWVGIFITALNLMPIGQLDGGHILYTLIGRRAHRVAIGLLLAAIVFMIVTRQISYILMVVLLVVAGPRHPPTADDTVPLGAGRIVVGWLTLAFVLIGFTLNPISFATRIERRPQPPPPQQQQAPAESIEVRALRRDRPSHSLIALDRPQQLAATAEVART
jgi:membrane-associated protease RseP (regulator of RpoE activity)